MAEKQLMTYAVGDQMNLMVLIKSAEVRVAKNGKKYLDFTFTDASGEMSGKFWDAGDATSTVINLAG